ncbi:hypothetical protein VC273_15360 [Xanthomonas nasturtii]|uniref:hypothetical protein n=1 Tax=Xanthomonas TaxID=338 RepID=UPI000B25E633|nr:MULTISPECIES: hypothetical protein [Xanthomonas]MEA9557239.1 hypothetical protein [Xanthomonas nasturtii]MEA9565593.1 hypothetical protein [Xanthomonas sp. WHRI 8932A]MEA9578999.1 hypothetical protein [Xanthomonas nasturtii]MEA9586185.1 hypothetical protein [Xanthomonas sp. WHRI 10064B]MEA9614612.1 hypothetical protein [Xanthomonas sp. WHRI 10064A]
MSNQQRQPDSADDDASGVSDSQDSRKQDETAKQRPGQEDLKVHDEHSRRPKGTAGQGE